MPADSLSKRAERGARADQIINDPVYQEAVDRLEAGVVEQLSRCDLTATDKMRALVVALQVGRKVRGALEAFMRDGEQAAHQMDSIAEAERKRGLMRNPFKR